MIGHILGTSLVGSTGMGGGNTYTGGKLMSMEDMLLQPVQGNPRMVCGSIGHISVSVIFFLILIMQVSLCFI